MTLAAVLLGLFLVAVGLSHFVFTDYYRSLVPPWVRADRAAVLASGVVELIVGVGLLVPAIRPVSAWAATGLMAVYVMVHVEAGRRASQASRPLDRPGAVAVRIAVNLAYLGWAATVAVQS